MILRGVLALAALLVTAIYLLSSQCERSGKSECEGMIDPDLALVIVSTEDIPAGTDLTQLLRGDGPFMELQIPNDALVQGAVTRVEQREGMLTTKTIGANEMIVESQLCPAEAFCQFGDAMSST